MLEKIVDSNSFSKAASYSLFAVSTVGAFAAGIYEGFSGDSLLGRSSGNENYTAWAVVGAGYASQLFAATITSDRAPDSSEKLTKIGLIVFPLMSLVGIACYGIGYGIGKLNQ